MNSYASLDKKKKGNCTVPLINHSDSSNVKSNINWFYEKNSLSVPFDPSNSSELRFRLFAQSVQFVLHLILHWMRCLIACTSITHFICACIGVLESVASRNQLWIPHQYQISCYNLNPPHSSHHSLYTAPPAMFTSTRSVYSIFYSIPLRGELNEVHSVAEEAHRSHINGIVYIAVCLQDTRLFTRWSFKRYKRGFNGERGSMNRVFNGERSE